MSSEPAPSPASDDAPAVRRLSGARRWLVYGVALALSVAVLLILPSRPALVLLVVLIVGALGLAAHDAGLTVDSLRAETSRLWNGVRRLRVRAGTPAERARRERWVIGLTLASSASMILSAIAFRPTDIDMPLDAGLLLFALGVVALGGALALARPANVLRRAASVPLLPRRSHAGMALLGVVLLALVAEISGGWLNLPMLERVSIHVQFALFVLGVSCLVLGMAGASDLAFSPRQTMDRARRWLAVADRGHLSLVLALVVLALGLRVWSVDTTVRLPIDEEHFIQSYFNLRADPTRDQE